MRIRMSETSKCVREREEKRKRGKERDREVSITLFVDGKLYLYYTIDVYTLYTYL